MSSDPSAEATSVALVGKSANEVEFCQKNCVSIVSSDDLTGLKFAVRRFGEKHLFDEEAADVVSLQHLSVRWQV